MAKEITIQILNEKGNKQTFKQNFIPASKVIRALDLIEQNNSERPMRDVIEERLNFIVEVLGNPKITEDTLLNGINGIDLMETLFNFICDVAGVDPKAMLAMETESQSKKQDDKS